MLPARSCTGSRAAVAAIVVLGLLLAVVPSFGKSKAPDVEPSPEAVEGAAQGKADARGNAIWIIPGMLLPGVGLILPWVFSPSVPADNLIGKSEDYVAAYRHAYIHRRKTRNFLWALAGFGVTATVLGGVAVATVVDAMASGAESCGAAISDSCSASLSNTCSSMAPSCSTSAIGFGSLGLLSPAVYALLAAP